MTLGEPRSLILESSLVYEGHCKAPAALFSGQNDENVGKTTTQEKK